MQDYHLSKAALYKYARVWFSDSSALVTSLDIGRLGEYFSGTVLGVAMVVPFVLTLAEFDHFWIGNAIYAAFVLSALVGTAVKLVAYRGGF